MKTNRPEVVAYFLSHKGSSQVGVRLLENHDPSCVSSNWNYEPLVRLSDYEALQSECEKLRKRICVSDGWRVVPVEPTPAMRAPWKTMRGYSWHDKYKAMLAAAPEPVERLATDGGRNQRFEGLFEGETPDQRDARLASAAPVERNQCDGCQAGIPVEIGMHRMGKPGGYVDLMACTADRYGSAPVERVEQEAKVFWVLFDNTGGEKYIKKCADAGTLAFFDNEGDAARAKRFNPGTDYMRVEYYTTPQPSPTACTGKNCGSTDHKLHSAECFAEHEQAIALTATQDVAGLVKALQLQEEFWAKRESELGYLSPEAVAVRAAGQSALAATPKVETATALDADLSTHQNKEGNQ